MKNMLTSRLRNASLIASVAVLAPSAVFAQDATSTLMDNSSGWIGGLIVWLLPIGGIFAVAVASAMDKSVRAGRAGTTVRR